MTAFLKQCVFSYNTDISCTIFYISRYITWFCQKEFYLFVSSVKISFLEELLSSEQSMPTPSNSSIDKSVNLPFDSAIVKYLIITPPTKY